MADLNKLKKKRSTLRALLTKLISSVEKSVEADDIDLETLEIHLESLNEKQTVLKSLNNEIENLISEDAVVEEIEGSEEINDKIVLWKYKISKKIKQLNSEPKNTLSSSNRSLSDINIVDKADHVKLPKLSIRKFSGDPSSWLDFFNVFENAIHNNSKLTKVDKFNYLKSYLEGNAAQCIGGFANTDENYDTTITLLKERFGNKNVLINAHLGHLLNLNPVKLSTDVVGLRKLYDKSETQIRSLQSLGITSDTYGNLLCPILMKLIPQDLVLEFNRNSNEEFDLEEFLRFLNKEIKSRERSYSFLKTDVKVNTCEQNMPSHLKSHFNRPRHDLEGNKQHMFGKSGIPTAVELFSAENKEDNKVNCVFCDSYHNSLECKYALDLSLADRKSILLKKGACFKCLKRARHISRYCKSKVSCSLCGSNRHYAILCTPHREYQKNNDKRENMVLSQSCSNEVYLQTLIVRIRGKKNDHLVRVIIDTGSQKSFITKFLAKRIGFKCLGEETVNHGLFGGFEKCVRHKRYLINLSSLNENYTCQLEVMDQDKICASIPKIQDFELIKKLNEQNICVSDFETKSTSCLFQKHPYEVHVLLGADVAGKLMTGKIEHLPCGLSAIHTLLGWTVMGKPLNENKSDSSLLVLSLHVQNAKITDLWNLDSLGIADPIETRTREGMHELALKHFEDTVSRDEEGRYQVCLPWLEDHPELQDHKTLSENRLKNTVKSLKTVNKLGGYEKVFAEWEVEGIIEQINTHEIEKTKQDPAVHYLPHRAVLKENSTTKIRPVFDGSAHSRNSKSLNDCIEKGPNLIEQIPSVLNRFRKGRIGVISDIKKAFLQISLHTQDRDFLRFLWWQNGDPGALITYRHCRVVFGISCSPFLLAATLAHHLNEVPDHLKELAVKLKDSMYVDNCVTSVDTEEELEYFRTESIKLLASAKFDLRGWQNNHILTQENMVDQRETDEMKNLEVPVLGLKWNIDTDTLSCDVREFEERSDPVTKRSILSFTHRIFDPIGFTSPITLIPKLLLQECWKIKASWDSELPRHIVKEFNKWKSKISELKNLKIPRRLSVLPLLTKNMSFHVFCDASKSGYACCIFLRVENEDETTCQLVQARSRVAPLKPMSIPRLELLACCIGSRLGSSVKRDLRMEDVKTTYWSDSMDVLHWIKREAAWVTFVENRVKEIRNLSEPSSWKFVPGVQNPADLPSRGCSAEKMITDRWWEGPDWLKKPKEAWPDIDLLPNLEVVNAEKKKIVMSTINKETNHFYHHISSYLRIIRITGWIYRFIENSKKSINRISGELNNEEIKRAECIILRCVQQEAFVNNPDKKLNSLATLTDSDGLIRIKTKIFLREDKRNFRLPIVLPSDHNVTKALITWKHKQLGHVGVQSLMVALREDYWILKSRKTIKRVIKLCITCQRYRVKPPTIIEGPLPKDRIKDASIFEIIGVDLAGPLILKNEQKAWILILTCAVFRAVHLELLTSVSTDNFLLGLRRFIARRGRPSVIYSDNGSNFVGANNQLKNLDWKKLKTETSLLRISWKFIPPAAPWWGGFWERLIGIMKRILRKVLGRTSLNYEEMSTVLCDCECLINSRPLTYVSDEIEDLQPLTPSMFLHEVKEIGVADLDILDSKKINKRFAYRQKIRQDLRVRFREEYLGQLKGIKTNNSVYQPEVGDIVILWSDNIKRMSWPLGRILELYTSRDGHVRLAKIRTKSGVFVRPLQKLCPMELDNGDDETCRSRLPVTNPSDFAILSPPVDTDPIKDSDCPLVHTRAGRVVRTPMRYRL